MPVARQGALHETEPLGMSTSWMAQQLSSLSTASTPTGPDVPRYNPRPNGVIRPGSATEAVLCLLRKIDGRYMNHAQIMIATGRTTRAVSWALVFLQAQGLIESTADDGRNPRYQRYRIKAGATDVCSKKPRP